MGEEPFLRKVWDIDTLAGLSAIRRSSWIAPSGGCQVGTFSS